jgi:hypothetical protein
MCERRNKRSFLSVFLSRLRSVRGTPGVAAGCVPAVAVPDAIRHEAAAAARVIRFIGFPHRPYRFIREPPIAGLHEPAVVDRRCADATRRMARENACGALG